MSLQKRIENFSERSGVDLAAIRDRLNRADACPKHRYEVGPGPYAMGTKYRCVHCGDERRMHEIGQYVRGYKAAGGDPRDVCPEWK